MYKAMYTPVTFDQKTSMCVRDKRVAHHHSGCKMRAVAGKSGRDWREGWAAWTSAPAGALEFGEAGILVGCAWV